MIIFDKKEVRVEDSRITCGCCSRGPNSRILTGTSTGKVNVHNLSDFTPVENIKLHDAAITSVELDHTQKLIASASDNYCSLWSLDSWKGIRRFHGHVGNVKSLSFSHPNRNILISTDNVGFRIWDIRQKDFLSFVELPEITDKIHCSPDGNWILASTTQNSGYCQLFDFSSTKSITKFVHQNIKGAKFHPNDMLLLSWDSVGTINLWDLATGSSNLINHEPGINSELITKELRSVCLSSNGLLVVAATMEGFALLNVDSLSLIDFAHHPFSGTIHDLSLVPKSPTLQVICSESSSSNSSNLQQIIFPLGPRFKFTRSGSSADSTLVESTTIHENLHIPSARLKTSSPCQQSVAHSGNDQDIFHTPDSIHPNSITTSSKEFSSMAMFFPSKSSSHIEYGSTDAAANSPILESFSSQKLHHIKKKTDDLEVSLDESLLKTFVVENVEKDERLLNKIQHSQSISTHSDSNSKENQNPKKEDPEIISYSEAYCILNAESLKINSTIQFLTSQMQSMIRDKISTSGIGKTGQCSSSDIEKYFTSCFSLLQDEKLCSSQEFPEMDNLNRDVLFNYIKNILETFFHIERPWKWSICLSFFKALVTVIKKPQVFNDGKLNDIILKIVSAIVIDHMDEWKHSSKGNLTRKRRSLIPTLSTSSTPDKKNLSMQSYPLKNILLYCHHHFKQSQTSNQSHDAKSSSLPSDFATEKTSDSFLRKLRWILMAVD